MKGPLYVMILLGLVGYSFGATRECYSCAYSSLIGTESSCEAPTSSATTATCDGQCSKYYSEVSGIISITRTCIPVCVAIDCVENSAGKVCTTCCDSDLCNGAASVTFNLVAIFVLMATARGLSK